MCLGRKDVLVINGGTNDSDKNSTKRNGILVMMTQLMHKYNTDIIVVNIPPRHVIAKNSSNSGTQCQTKQNCKIIQASYIIRN
jgi:hypothetical protein